MKILVSGGTGLLGKKLVRILLNLGHNVDVLTRNLSHDSPQNYFYWNPSKEQIDSNALKETDCIIHLAGADISSSRWTQKRKKILFNSRIESAKFLHKKCLEFNVFPKFFISCSAVGFYGGINNLEPRTEDMNSYNDFLGILCKDWENAANLFKNNGCQVSKIRLGLVLSQNGGALPKMSFPIKYGVGSVLGSGMQSVPWIHIEDLCHIFIQLINGSLPHSVYNAVSPHSLTNKEFTECIARVINRHLWLPNIPSFILWILFGEMSVILLKGSHVSAEKLLQNGFSFKFPKLSDALCQIWDQSD